MILLLGLAVVSVGIYAIVRGVDVRLALFLAAMALGVLGGQPMAVVRVFLVTLADEKFVVPICCAMGFAHVLRLTQCDRHLVQLLVEPLRRVRGLLIPGTVLVGFCVNMPIISQTSTAVTIGPVLIPLLLAARISPVTLGAALLLGSSVGGELLNPGAPELRTTVEATQKAMMKARTDGDETDRAKPSKDERRSQQVPSVSAADCVGRIVPLLFVHLAVATVIFWVLSARFEARFPADVVPSDQPAPPAQLTCPLRIHMALVPLVPLVLLFLTARPFEVFAIPRGWLLVNAGDKAELLRFDSRLIGAAMLIGVAVATAASPRSTREVARAFFDGAGYAFANIISLIVIASCLGEGVKLIGLADVIGSIIADAPSLLIPLAGVLPLGFAWLCGSGMAATQSLFGFFAGPALDLDIDPAHVGGVVSIAAAAGRTMSPVAAVTLMCAAMTETSPFLLVRRVALPLLVGVMAMLFIAGFLAFATELVYIG